MKGLKTLTAVVLGIALLASAAPASAKKSAAFKHYVACGLSQNAKPSHVCQKARDKGAFFRSNKRDVFYTVCVNFPRQEKPLRPQAGSGTGDALREQDHLQHPGQAPGHLVRRGQAGRRLLLHGPEVADADIGRLRHRDRRHRRRRDPRRRGPLRGAARPLRERRAAAHDGAARGGRAGGRCGRRLGGGRGGSRSASAPAPSPGCGSGSPRARALGLSRGPAAERRRHARRAGARARRGCRRAALPRRPRRPPRRGLRGALLGGGRAALGALAGSSGGARRATSRSCPKRRCAADRGRYDFRQQLTSRAVEIPDDADPVHRVAARHVCALAAAMGRRGRIRFRRPDLPEAPRCGTVA